MGDESNLSSHRADPAPDDLPEHTPNLGPPNAWSEDLAPSGLSAVLRRHPYPVALTAVGVGWLAARWLPRKRGARDLSAHSAATSAFASALETATPAVSVRGAPAQRDTLLAGGAMLLAGVAAAIAVPLTAAEHTLFSRVQAELEAAERRRASQAHAR